VSYLSETHSKDINRISEVYKELFAARYEIPALNFTSAEGDIVARLVQRLGTPKIIKLLHQFFKMPGIGKSFKGEPNDWFTRNSHSVKVFERDLAPISAASGVGPLMDNSVYVIGYSERGYPVCINDPTDHPELFRGFERLKWDQWLAGTDHQRLQSQTLLWAENDVVLWRTNWRKWEHQWTYSNGRAALPKKDPDPATMAEPGPPEC